VVHDPKKGELGFLVAQAGHQLNVLGCLWVYHRGLIRNLPKKTYYILFLSTRANLLTCCTGDPELKKNTVSFATDVYTRDIFYSYNI
jgi:hypothetical protein